MPTTKKNIKIYFLFALILLFFTPFFITMAEDATPTTIIQLEQPLPGMPSTASGPAQYISYLYIAGLAIVGLVAVTTLAFGGFLYMTSAGNDSQIDTAKEIMGGAIAGVILLIGAYLILNTINPKLSNLKDPTLNIINNPPGGTSGGNTVADDSAARNQLMSTGITINKSNCTNAGQTSCTSLSGIRQTTISGVEQLKTACGNSCPINITAGTEAGHDSGQYSHANGYKVDLSLNNTLDAFIETHYTPSGLRSSDGAKLYKDNNGNIYAKEAGAQPHWDVTYF